VGLAQGEFGDPRRPTLKWAVAICLCILLAALLFGISPRLGSARSRAITPSNIRAWP